MNARRLNLYWQYICVVFGNKLYANCIPACQSSAKRPGPGSCDRYRYNPIQLGIDNSPLPIIEINGTNAWPLCLPDSRLSCWAFIS
jgi:hypothetical protein